MKKTTKRILAIVMAMTMAFGLTACGSDKKVEKPEEEQQVEEQTPETEEQTAKKTETDAPQEDVATEKKTEAEKDAEKPADGLMVAKKDGYDICEVRYATPDGTPIKMDVRYTELSGDNQIFANMDSAKEAGVLDVIEKDGVYAYTIKEGAHVAWVFTPVKETAPEGFDDTKKDIPCALNSEADGNSGKYSVYTVTIDYKPAGVQPTVEVVEK